MLSMANTRSDHSTTSTTSSSGVASNRPRRVRQKNRGILLRLDPLFLPPQHPQAGQHQDAAKDVYDPLEALQQQGAERDHDEPHHDRAENPPFQHLRLRGGGDAEIGEDQNEDEEIVDAERELDQVAGVVLEGVLPPLPPQDQETESKGKGDEPETPAHRLLEPQRVRAPVEYSQVQDQQPDHQRREAEPDDGRVLSQV